MAGTDNTKKSADSERQVLELRDSMTSLRSLSMRRAHRLGRFQTSKSRPLTACFLAIEKAIGIS